MGWDDPNSDPIGDVRAAVKAARDAYPACTRPVFLVGLGELECGAPANLGYCPFKGGEYSRAPESCDRPSAGDRAEASDQLPDA